MISGKNNITHQVQYLVSGQYTQCNFITFDFLPSYSLKEANLIVNTIEDTIWDHIKSQILDQVVDQLNENYNDYNDL